MRGELHNCSPALLKPATDLAFQGFHALILIRVTFLKAIEQTFYGSTSRREDAQPDHDKENSLKKREKKSHDSETNKEPSKDQNSDALHFFPRCGYYYNSSLQKSIDPVILMVEYFYEFLV